MDENVDVTQLALKRLNELLEYVHHLSKISQKPVFKIEEYNRFRLWEHEIRGKISIQHNITDKDGVNIWLKIERLRRTSPPTIHEDIIEWVVLTNDPYSTPQINNKIIKSMDKANIDKLLQGGIICNEDIMDPIINRDDVNIDIKEVILRIDKFPELKSQINKYINEQWLSWAEEEKPRRETIKIYDMIFSLLQLIEAQGDEQSIELIWGVGIARWDVDGHKINIPLIEKPVEIEISHEDSAILIMPRQMKPILSLDPFYALENPGTDDLFRFGKKHFEMSEDIDFSPYLHESFEPILRHAANCLSESGIYWPDINENKDNRNVNKISDTLEITDSWILFSRPRSTSVITQDIQRFKDKLEKQDFVDLPEPVKKLVTEHSDSNSFHSMNGLSSSDISNSSVASDSTIELYFPKSFNDAQKEIIYKLEKNDGVVVQGPPGTGKTHTIANIICHYLATGRTVLVTSKYEPALSVLQDQIPEEIRSLTISLLTNERQGMKQFESAIHLLVGIVSQKNLKGLQDEIAYTEKHITQIKSEMRSIDRKIEEWGLKQLQPISNQLYGGGKEISAMELAQNLIHDSDRHSWFPDILGSSDEYNPKFSDSDVALIRNARKRLGVDIVYVEKNIPPINDMPDVANIVAMHEALSAHALIDDVFSAGDLPLLSASEHDAIERANVLCDSLRELQEILIFNSNNEWLDRIFKSWVNESLRQNDEVLNSLFAELESIVKRRALFVSHIDMQDPLEYLESVKSALCRLIDGKSAFSILKFGVKETKLLINNIKINGAKPNSVKQWQYINEYIKFQNDVRRFVCKWNHVGQELSLPNIDFSFGDSLAILQDMHNQIEQADTFISTKWLEIKNELKLLFPYGIVVDILLDDSNELNKTIEAIKANVTRARLGLQKLKLQDLNNKIKAAEGPILDQIKDFLQNKIGNLTVSSGDVVQTWQGYLNEIIRINTLARDLDTVKFITDKISDSGSNKWALQLKSIPLIDSDDLLTPTDWYKTWQWKRLYEYIREIDKRKELSKFAERRAYLEEDVKKAFTELVRIKTHIGLHMSMTEKIQGALMRFVSAISKIGKGTGKRSPRHKRDAYNAMQNCYEGIPCWIMPTWRISENLPSDFGLFDLVIIDEASQSDVMAIMAILRAKKLLVVGDDKQVSPTAAFVLEDKILQLRKYLKGQPFLELFLPEVSIYDLANVLFPNTRIMLAEHFRCVEPIIRFSMQFYSEALIPLRIPKASERITPPLVDVYVKNGRRNSAEVNELEAEAIVSEIKSLIGDSKFNERSIGVISLVGEKQAKYIQEILLNELGEDVYERYQIACGDPTTFQGKEKDIIFISMVVGFKQGAVLVKRADEQRVNVALSRARDRMYLYRSIDETELTNQSDLRLKILRHFSNPMRNQQQSSDLLEKCHPAFERQFAKKLLEMNYNVIPQVKVGHYSIDLVVEGENDRRLAIELDGDKYHPPEQWLADWNRQRTMERVGWKFWRCWGSSYALDPKACFDDLITTLDAMQIYPYKHRQYENIYTEYRVYEKPEPLLDENINKGDTISDGIITEPE